MISLVYIQPSLSLLDAHIVDTIKVYYSVNNIFLKKYCQYPIAWVSTSDIRGKRSGKMEYQIRAKTLENMQNYKKVAILLIKSWLTIIIPSILNSHNSWVRI